MAKHPSVTVVLDHTVEFLSALEELTSKAVFVGVPSATINREPEPGEKTTPNNAVIAYVQENGDPAKNIPARPFLVPAIRENQVQITARLKAITQAAMEFNISKIQNLRIQLGLFAQREVQKKITDGPFVPLSEVTLKRRAMRQFGKGAAGARKGAMAELARRAAGQAAGNDLARPLIDTGQLRRAINFVIGPNRNRKKTIRAMVGDWPVFVSDGKK